MPDDELVFVRVSGVMRISRAEKWEAIQIRTRAKASHHGQPWTGREFTVIEDLSLSNEQCADQLGRTLKAVRTMRQSHGIHPTRANT